MASDTDNIIARLKSVIPAWFPQTSPILDGVLSGFATVAAWGKGLLLYAQAQTRLATASDGFLDIAALDFFGMRIKRKPAQPDDALRAVIKKEVLRERGTRRGILGALQDLTGNPAKIFEPLYSNDTGGWSTGSMGWSQAGAWGSNNYPYQVFLNVVEPIGVGVPNVAGWGSSYGAWGGGYSAFTNISSIIGSVTHQDIYDMIEATRAAGITAWVNIGTPPIKTARLDIDFYLDSSQLG